MGSGTFSFDIGDSLSGKTRRIEVNNSRIEIDSAYEGTSCLALFEAKRDLSKDFLVRQLYYPFRVWQKRVNKTIQPVFLVYSNGIYRLYEYAFENPDNYGSLHLIKRKNYSVEDTAISSSDIQKVVRDVEIVHEPEIPFPRADKFERIINLCEILSGQELSGTDVTERYDFDSRQTNYYTDAARYLGLLEKRKESATPFYSLSDAGRRILDYRFRERQLAFCKTILSHKAFNSALRLYFKKGAMPSTDEIVEAMKQSVIYRVESESTLTRRSSSVKGWINWIVSLIDGEKENLHP